MSPSAALYGRALHRLTAPEQESVLVRQPACLALVSSANCAQRVYQCIRYLAFP